MENSKEEYYETRIAVLEGHILALQMQLNHKEKMNLNKEMMGLLDQMKANKEVEAL